MAKRFFVVVLRLASIPFLTRRKVLQTLNDLFRRRETY